ncbi:MAG: ABC transporter substrate-binding protein [Candidatus Heimdallarchaeota archaeon]
MNNSVKKYVTLVIMFSILATSFYSTHIINTESVEPFFTLVAKAKEHSIHVDYLHLAKQQLQEIGIDLYVMPMWSLIGELIAYRDFDMVSIGFSGGGIDPDFTGVYNENGSLNIFGYHTSMDFNETLGTGLNEWYMKQGTLITPPNSDERIQHYWDWENYLMDEILPCLPSFTSNTYDAYWNNLKGYNISKGILQSWGNMSWESTHLGQLNTNEFVIADYPWSFLNPVFQDDVSSAFISKCLLDPLLYFDDDNIIRPHLAESFSYINDTHLRIITREGIEWQDYGGFENEPFNAEDVYFTLSSWATVSNDIASYDWIEKVELIDDRTIDFYIDGNPSTIENEPYAPIFRCLNTLMLPEHYLNQTQLLDGITPDISDESWYSFGINCFGTGLFEMDTFTKGVETILKVKENSWWLNNSITSDPVLDWENRFGDFSDLITYLKIKIELNSQSSLNGFVGGVYDYYSFNDLNSYEYQMEGIEGTTFQKKMRSYFGFFGFNMRPVRTVIGNPEPCEEDPTITKGLAVRKAISYAINREEINEVVHGGEYSIINYPIFETMGIWCNPNIIKYDHDLEMAKYYMSLAGYDVPDHIYTLPENFLWLYILSGTLYLFGTGAIFAGIIFLRRKKPKGVN